MLKAVPTSVKAVREHIIIAPHHPDRLRRPRGRPGAIEDERFRQYPLSNPQYQRLLARDTWERLQASVSANAGAARNVSARAVNGDPSTEIARIATDVDADLIVVGVTPRGAIGRRILGSTAARLIRTAGRPVLAIPELVGRKVAPVSEGDQRVVAA